ncbi:MAG TPA: hypothetical protein VF492_04370 [Verrucomicrobiae bacterium]
MAEKKTTKSKQDEQAQLLNLLRIILPKVAPDAALAAQIYSACEAELRAKNRVNSFEKFCERIELPDLEPKTIEEVKQHFAAGFGDADMDITPDEEGKALNVDVSLPDGTQFHKQIPVRPVAPDTGDEPEVTLKFVAFPVAMPGDQELIWSLAKRENLTNDEAAIALTKIEDDFWASKAGQKCLKDRVERSFPEFIARVPAGLLNEVGLKRHYKLPEALKVLRTPVKKA